MHGLGIPGGKAGEAIETISLDLEHGATDAVDQRKAVHVGIAG